MPVHVDQLSTEVIPEPESGVASADGGTNWEEIARLRRMQAALDRDRRRTAAGGFDD